MKRRPIVKGEIIEFEGKRYRRFPRSIWEVWDEETAQYLGYVWNSPERENLEAAYQKELERSVNPEPTFGIDYLDMVAQWQDAMDLPRGLDPTDDTTIDTVNAKSLRAKLAYEEEMEYAIEIAKRGKDFDKAALLKEACDKLYILLGDLDTFGMLDLFPEAFRLVHKSNMSKLDENGKPVRREDGKILKGPNYVKPDLSVLFNDKQNGE